MSYCEELHQLLTNEVIGEVNNVAAQMESYAAEHESTPEMEQERAGIRAIRDNFLNIIQAIETEQIDERNCRQILEELTALRSMMPQG